MCPQGCLAPPGGGILQNPGKDYLQAEYGNGTLPPGLCDVEALPKLLLLPLCFAPRMGLIFKPLPRLRACFLRNLTLPVYCLSLVLFPVIRFVTVSLLKIPFNSHVLPVQYHPGKITFCITETASRLPDCPQHQKET